MNTTDKDSHETIHEREFAQNSIKSLFIKYTIPGLIGMLFVGIQVILDGVIVGNYLGAEALASVNIVLPLISLFTAFTLVIGIGSLTLVSMGQGERDYKKARNAMTTGFMASIMISLVTSLVLVVWDEQILTLLGCNDALLPAAKGYLLGLFPFSIAMGCAMYNEFILRATGHPRMAMTLMAASVVLNIILNISFVTIFQLGTFGIGLATGISFGSSAIVSTIFLQGKQRAIRLLSGKFKSRLLGNALYNGSSEGINELAAGVIILLFNLTLITFIGSDGVAAFSVINYIYFMGMCLFIGISNGIIPIISYNFGAKQFHRCKEAFRFTAYVNGCIGLAIALGLMIFNRPIIELFLDDSNEAIVDLAAKGARIYAIAFLMNWFNIQVSGLFTAIGNAKNSALIAILRGLVFLSIAIYCIPRTIGIEYIWYAAPIAELLTLLVSLSLYLRLRRQWKH